MYFLVFLSASAGAGESGKSTVVRQMKIIYNNGFSVKELSEFKVRSDSVYALVCAWTQR